MSRPRLVCLHGLGGSARTFDPLAAQLDGDADVAAVDLPGFGTRAGDSDGGDLEAMVRAAAAAVPTGDEAPWFLLGHSMGGKVAMLLTRRLLDARGGFRGDPRTAAPPAGLIHLAPSPPTPEPIDEGKRAEMIRWAREGISPELAREFFSEDCALPLSDQFLELGVEQVLAASTRAWEAWFATGSQEDRGEEVGTLDLPALVLGGDDDEALGAPAQPLLLARALPGAAYVRLARTGHQMPLERPAEVADAIRRFVAAVAR